VTAARSPGGPVRQAEDLSALYRERFSPKEVAFRRDVWRVLVERVFQPLVPPGATVLDLGAGRCEFLSAIACAVKIAVDLDPAVAQHAGDARVVIRPGWAMTEVPGGSVDLLLASNVLEHLAGKEEVLATLRECRRVLRPGGRIVVLGPNIRYLPGRYWDYFDHVTPLSHRSVVEGLALAGFAPERVVPRFLPYTVKDAAVPRSTRALRLYLSAPFLWPLFGRQMLVIARSGA
jgi:SAM-dependent methyltransferase